MDPEDFTSFLFDTIQYQAEEMEVTNVERTAGDTLLVTADGSTLSITVKEVDL